MNVVLAGDFDAAERQVWSAALQQAMPETCWLTPEQARSLESMRVQAAVVANPPPGSLAGLGGLRLVQSLWAGVDQLLADTSIPADVPLARMVDPAMSAAMAETALWAVLSLHRGFFEYAGQQRDTLWKQLVQRCAAGVRVLVLGAGAMGSAVAARLAPLGYALSVWHRDGAVLEPLLANADIVVNLLPLTRATRGIIDARFLAALPRGAALVNLARGAHVVDDALLVALDDGHLGRAVLDVFNTEPLPPGHRYWHHPRVTVLPHAAALTDPHSSAAVVASNLRSLRDGGPLAHLVDRARGY